MDARPFFSPLSTTPPFLKLASQNLASSLSHMLPQVSLNLPCCHDLTQQQIEQVVSLIEEALDDC